MSSPSFTRIRVVLLPGEDTRVLGGSARERNSRVATRAGAAVIDATALAEQDSVSVIVVPPKVLIDIPLFSAPIPSTATWLEGMAGACVLVGPAREVARYVHTGHAQAARDRTVRDRRQGGLGRNGAEKDDGLPRQRASPDGVFDISNRSSRGRAVWRILKRTAKPTDGWVSRRCNRPISRLISFVLLSMGLKPSHASAMTLLVGLATAVQAVRPGYVTLVFTGILFQLASVLDGVDGEMARATLTESEAGARLDAIVDQLTYLACFIGITIGWAREGGGAQAFFWTVAIAIALLLSLMRGGRFVSRFAPDASFVFIDRAVRRAARESNLLALRMAASFFSLLRRDLFAVVFLLVSFFGRRALIPGLVGFGVVLANITLSVYRRELEAAALLERG